MFTLRDFGGRRASFLKFRGNIVIYPSKWGLNQRVRFLSCECLSAARAPATFELLFYQAHPSRCENENLHYMSEVQCEGTVPTASIGGTQPQFGAHMKRQQIRHLESSGTRTGAHIPRDGHENRLESLTCARSHHHRRVTSLHAASTVLQRWGNGNACTWLALRASALRQCTAFDGERERWR